MFVTSKRDKLFVKQLDEATSFCDLVPILQTVDLDELKNLVKSLVSKYNGQQKSKLYSYSLKIEAIIDNDVMQHTLSFLRKDETACVCKLFNQLCQKNDEKMTRELMSNAKYKNSAKAHAMLVEKSYLNNIQSTIDQSIEKMKKNLTILKKKQSENEAKLRKLEDSLFELQKQQSLFDDFGSNNSNLNQLPKYPIQYNRDFNKRFMVEPDRLEEETDSLEYGLTHCKNGDQIVVARSDYMIYDEFCDIKKSVTIMSKQSKSGRKETEQAVLKPEGDCEVFLYLNNNCNVLLKDICIDSREFKQCYEGTIEIGSNCKLWMQNCTIKTGAIGIRMGKNSSLFVKDCSFIGGSQSSHGIIINPQACDVMILNSTFMNFGNEYEYYYKGQAPAISITSDAYNVRFVRDIKVNVKIINNVFCNNHGYPISYSKCHFSKYLKSNTKCQITGNKLKGYNGSSIDCKRSQFKSVKDIESNLDANTVYHNTQLDKIDLVD